jgi:hypothetical protein
MDSEIAQKMEGRLDSLKMGRSEYIANLIRNDLLTSGANFQIVVEVPDKASQSRKKKR